MRESIARRVAYVGVIVLHGIAVIAVVNIPAPNRRSADEFPSTFFDVEPRKQRKDTVLRVKPKRRKQVDASRIDTPPTSTTPLSLPTIDWETERGRAAGNAVTMEAAQTPGRSLLSTPKVIELPPKGDPVHKRGDSQHFDDGEIITWINDRCYVTNKERIGPQLIPNQINIRCRRKPKPMQDDLFAYQKPKYLRDPDAPAPKFQGVFSDNAKCEYSAFACAEPTP